MAAEFKTWVDGEEWKPEDANEKLMRQSVIKCANATERNAIPTPQEGMTVYLADIDAKQVYTGTRWKWQDPRILGTNLESSTLVLLTTALVTQLTLDVDTLGGELLIETSALTANASSGAFRSIAYEIWEDGVKVAELAGGAGVPYIAAGSPENAHLLTIKRTPAAGSHTYEVKMSASANSAVWERCGILKITETT